MICAGKSQIPRITSVTCPCGSDVPYGRCCGPYLDAGALPGTAVGLMRSRYTAYVLARAEYLLQSWHASTRPVSLALTEAPAIKWLGLEIVNTHAGGALDQTGTVEFVARYKVRGKAERLHEISRFIRQDGQWFYLEGDLDLHR